MNTIGREKSQGLLGFHNFTGNDYGHKFVGITKKKWSKIYLDLPSHDSIVGAFSQLGILSPEHFTFEGGELHESILPLERFTCMGYCENGPFTIPALRWKLWSGKNKESENLPPTRATIIPHIQRSDYMSRMHKAYDQAIPALPPVTESGWTRDVKTKVLMPQHCLLPPAPKSILELIKCGCGGICECRYCTCWKNQLPCTSLCKCSEDCTNDQW